MKIQKLMFAFDSSIENISKTQNHNQNTYTIHKVVPIEEKCLTDFFGFWLILVQNHRKTDDFQLWAAWRGGDGEALQDHCVVPRIDSELVLVQSNCFWRFSTRLLQLLPANKFVVRGCLWLEIVEGRADASWFSLIFIGFWDIFRLEIHSNLGRKSMIFIDFSLR